MLSANRAGWIVAGRGLFIILILIMALKLRDRQLQKQKEPSPNDHHSASQNQPAQEWTLGSVETLNHDHYANQTQQRSREKRAEIVAWATLVTVIIYTVVTAALWCSQLQANKTNDRNLIETNRAWINLYAIRLERFPSSAFMEIGNPIHFILSYANVGKSPALGTHWKYVSGYVAPPLTGDFSKIAIPENRTCVGLAPIDGSGTEFNPIGLPPDAMPGVETVTRDAENQPVLADQDMITGKHLLYIQGCVAYWTMGQIGITQFCHYIRPLFVSEGKPLLDNRGLPEYQDGACGGYAR